MADDKELGESPGYGKDEFLEITYDKFLEINFNVFTFSLEPFLIKMMKRLIINIFKNGVKPTITCKLEKNINYFKCKGKHKTILLDSSEEKNKKKNEARSYSNSFLSIAKHALNGYSEKIINMICELITLGRYLAESKKISYKADSVTGFKKDYGGTKGNHKGGK